MRKRLGLHRLSRAFGQLGRGITRLVLATCASFACLTSAQPTSAPPRVPLIYCTDLFHPHDDPDDHFDLATIFAIPEFDIRCVILDQGDQQLKRPGKVAVAQLNQITGRSVPAVPGLGAKLRSPTDAALDQPEQFQQGVATILCVLRTSTPPVMIATVGSVRDVVAAFNREPSLFYEKVGKVMAFIGEASKEDFREHNVELDPSAYIGLMRSGLPVYWVPCFDGGLWQNGGHASFWQARHSEVLSNAAPQLVQYFIYALEKRTADPLRFLALPANPVSRADLMAGRRNLWCTAIFASLAGRELAREGVHFVSKPRPLNRPEDRTLRNELFAFEEVDLRITDGAVVKYGADPEARKVLRFVVRDRANYARGMTEATAGLLASLRATTPGAETNVVRVAPTAATQSNAPPALTPLQINSVLCISNRVFAKNGADTNRTRILFAEQKWTKESTNPTIRNRNCWLHGAKGFTAISPWNEHAVYFSPGTPVSPRHVLMASHNRTGPTNRFEFVTADNQIVRRNMIAQTNCPALWDLTIGLLDDDLPPSIGFLRVLPPGWRDLLPTPPATSPLAPPLDLDKHRLREYLLPIVGFNHWKHAFVADLVNMNVFVDRNVWFPDWFGRAGGGDSGHPLCLLVNDELILFTHYTSVTGGLPYSDRIADINASMEGLSRAHGAPVYRLTMAEELMRLKSR